MKFLAIILRLGDLLDLSSDRACPLLLNAACPLSAESFAHWSQYQHITHRSTAPDEIQITAECMTQDEHRVLQDWCQWIVDETRNARIVMALAARHHDWRPPKAGLEPPEQTIVIRPARQANYVPSRWTFELDREAVFERLIHDVYGNRLSFVRELIQNSLDAMRCQLYSDLAVAGLEPPDSPTKIEEARRREYALHIGVETRRAVNELSGEVEEKEVVIVDDCGIGMDQEVIERYLLQVGRSFYTTEAFRRVFKFVPTSQFGIGFLSVFAVSDQVIIDTYKPSSGSGPIRCVLTGPRSYLLRERGNRSTQGTRVEVLLRDRLAPGELGEMVDRWCRRVEFPIALDDRGARKAIVAERPAAFVYEMPDVTQRGAQFVVRAFPVDRPGIEGELYVFARVDRNGESWAASDYAQHRYPSSHPQAVRPPFVANLRCLHGLAIAGGERHQLSSPASMRIDFRGPKFRPELSRLDMRGRVGAWRMEPELADRWHELLIQHLAESPLAKGPSAWRYKQRLVRLFGLSAFWAAQPTIPLFERGRLRIVAAAELTQRDRITCVTEAYWSGWTSEKEPPTSRQVGVPRFSGDDSVLTSTDLRGLSDEHLEAIFVRRRVGKVHVLRGRRLAIDWVLEVRDPFLLGIETAKQIGLAILPWPKTIGIKVHRINSSLYECVLLNQNHPLVQWLLRVREACTQRVHGLSTDQFRALMDFIDTPIRWYRHELEKLATYLEQWRAVESLPSELRPPEVQLDESFPKLPTLVVARMRRKRMQDAKARGRASRGARR